MDRVSSRYVVAIIQARMGSSRLPGKVLLDIAGQPMLARVVERTRRARTVERVVVATTTEVQDDAVAALCQARGYPVYRGSLHDVLDRYYQAARLFEAEIIVRITADCPIIDPRLIDETVNVLFDPASADFAANRLPPPWQRTYPIGLDVEACTFAALERAWKEATEPHHREHVMPYFYEGIPPDALAPGTSHAARRTPHACPEQRRRVALGTSPRGFRIALLHHDPDYGSLRWTVDTAEDLELVRRIYARFERNDFSWLDVVALFAREPELAQINAGVVHKTAYDVDAHREGR